MDHVWFEKDSHLLTSKETVVQILSAEKAGVNRGCICFTQICLAYDGFNRLFLHRSVAC